MRAIPVLLVLVACGPGAPRTLNDGCYGISSTLCDRSRNCGTLKGTAGDCRAELTRFCCGTNDCSKVLNAAQVTYFQGCDNALRALTCAQLAVGTNPSACQ